MFHSLGQPLRSALPLELGMAIEMGEPVRLLIEMTELLRLSV